MWFRRFNGAPVKVTPAALCAALALAFLAAGGTAGSAAAQGVGDLFTVRDVAVDETAATAADARQQAIATGQRRAFRRLMERLVPEDQQPLIPNVDANALQYYVLDFSVNNERASTVRYLADMTFRFSPDEVRNLLRQNGVAFSETRSKPVVVLPVYSDTVTEPTLWLEANPWRDAWAQRPGDDGLVPMIVPLGDVSDIATVDAQAALAGDSEPLRNIADLYGAEDVLVTHASMTGNPDDGTAVLQVVTRRYHEGSATIAQRDKLVQVTGEPFEGFLQRAAERVDSAVQEYWKQQYLLQFGNQRSILVYVPLAGLNDWLTVRKRLQGVAAVQQTTLTTLSKREAQLEIAFVGDEQRLTRALAQRDLFLALRPDSNWELTLSDRPRPAPAPSGGVSPVFGGDASGMPSTGPQDVVPTPQPQ